MTIFNVLSLICGLSLFLFGMNFMGDTLKKSAGTKLKTFLGTMTSTKFKGLLLGLAVTAIIQSSSATTVMAVGFVNSGVITLAQATGVVMGASIGTTVTAWLTGLSGIETSGAATVSSIMQWLKPSAFVPILAIIGVCMYMLAKSNQKKNIGMILLGFSVLMVGMDMMSDAVKPLSTNDEFKQILLFFENPILGVLVGAVFTAIIQSSSASVGILQSLTVTGAITFGNALPILLGMNIGTCITALISSIGTNTNAKRTAFVHFYFKVVGAFVFLGLFYLTDLIVDFPFTTGTIDMWEIAILHTVFNIINVIVLGPFSGLLEKFVCVTIKDKKNEDEITILDERLIATPSVAIERCNHAIADMADTAIQSFEFSSDLIYNFDSKKADQVRSLENKADKYEDMIGSYLIKLSPECRLATENMEVSKLLHMIGDFERISDHAVNIVESAEEIKDKKIEFSNEAVHELKIMASAVTEIINLSISAIKYGDINKAILVEPLEEVIDDLRDEIKRRHIIRLQNSKCTIEHGFVLSDLLTNYERIADHCSNIAACIIEVSKYKALDMHNYSEHIKENDITFEDHYNAFSEKYSLSV